MKKLLALDLAGTIIHKHGLYDALQQTLFSGTSITVDQIRVAHTQLSECVDFPDRPSTSFYEQFNDQLARMFGVDVRIQQIQDAITACSSLEWQPYDDVRSLASVSELAIFSNFSSKASQIIESVFTSQIPMVISEEIDLRKPSQEFYQYAITVTGCEPKDIMYVGDSPRLDYYPAQKLGMTPILLDRHSVFPDFPGIKVSSLKELPE